MAPGTSLKGPSPQHHDGRGLRVGIVHARWNETVIGPLLDGAVKELLKCGVAEKDIVVESVPGSWELPVAVQRLYAASQVQASQASAGGGAGDLLSMSSSSADLTAASSSSAPPSRPFDALIAIGVLIKGETQHFEYISDSVSQGLMRVGLDTGVPVIFGVLTVLTEEQAKARAGLTEGGHNHGSDWGLAAVEMAVKRGMWAAGKLE